MTKKRKIVSFLFIISLLFIILVFLLNKTKIKNKVFEFARLGANCENITYPNKKETTKITFTPKGYNVKKLSGSYLVVYKKDKIMHLYQDGKVTNEYQVNLRGELEDRKIWEDDQTPEGHFYIETMNHTSSPARCRWMRVNTTEHARNLYIKAYGEEGESNISSFEEKYGKIDSDGKIRSFNNIYKEQKYLRGIGIHGGGIGKIPRTIGCVSLDDDNIMQLFDTLKPYFKKNKRIDLLIVDKS